MVALFVAGGSHMSAVSTTALSKTTTPSHAENITEPSEIDDSFFSAWLASPSQQQEAKRSPSSKSPLSPKHQSSSSTVAVLGGDEVSCSEQQLQRAPTSEQSAVDTGKKVAAYSQFQPISVSISDDRRARPENTNVMGLLMSANTAETEKTNISKHNEIKFDENVSVDKGGDLPETSVAVLESSSSEDGTDGLSDEQRVVLSSELQLDTSASLACFNVSEMSSSILSPNPDELLGVEEDFQLESGWNDMTDIDARLSSADDLPEIESGDISTAVATSKPADVDYQSGTVSVVADSVDRDDQNSDNDELPCNIPQDTSEVDVKVLKEVPSLESSTKEISSLEGSLEASADEMSEGNKTVVAEDSDIYCEDTDVDEMQMSGSARSGIQQEHSLSGWSSEVCRSSASVVEEQGLSSGTDAEYQLAEYSVTHGDDGSDSGGTLPPGSGCVKNLLEEAMADSSTRGSTGSVEPVRIESGGNSGHTSADEIDTTTSSDIEIISHTSSVNGRAASMHGSRPVDVSPSRHSKTPFTSLSGQHRRSDSGSSAQSLQSRTDDDFASPDGDHGRDYLSRLGRESRRYFAKSDPG